MQHRLKYIFTCLLIATATTCNRSGNTNHAAADNNSTQAADSLTFEINQVLQQGQFNGFAVAIVNEKGILYQKGFGCADAAAKKPYTVNTIQNIASVSKTLVGIALMKAQESGKLQLDDPVNKYLPFQVVNPNYPRIPITIRQLATHTSTITDNEFYLSENYFLKPGQHASVAKPVFDDTQVFNDYDSVETMPALLQDLLTTTGKFYTANSFLNAPPGERYEYSNTGTTLAAYIIEQATGISFNDFTRQYIFQPLQMHSSGWAFDEVNFTAYSKLYENPTTVLPFYAMATYPDGNLITSIHDLGNYLTELIKGYNGNGTILSKASYTTLFRPQLTAKNFTDRNERNPYSESYNVGIFMGFGYSGYIGHTGGDPGVVSIMFFDPKTNTGRVMMFNTSITDKAGNDAFYSIWDKLERYQHKFSN